MCRDSPWTTFSWPGIVLEDVSGLSSDNISLTRIVLGVVGIVLGRHFLTQNCLGIVGIVLEQHFLHGICSLGKNLKLFTAARVSRPQDPQEPQSLTSPKEAAVILTMDKDPWDGLPTWASF